MKLCFLVFALIISFTANAIQQNRPTLASGQKTGELTIDGSLDEPDWQNAPVLTDLTKIEPTQGGDPTGKTEIRVIANETSVSIGIKCFDPDPASITAFSKLRDTNLNNEDHIRIVIDAFQDGQSGYIFAVNANGARYDALVSNRGEDENQDWDAIWEAVVQRTDDGWSVEMNLPIQSIAFRKGLDSWGFNVERRIQRYLETLRWANASIDQWFIQTSRAGLLTGLPEFNYGVGMNIRPSITTNTTKLGGESYNFTAEPTLDLSQRVGPNAVATVTVNTDFAETEVDTRQTNLTRFPLFFPEKRAFFLEGADIFEFGFGLGNNLIPFFSRSIGAYRGNLVPVVGGVKFNGRFGRTSAGGLVMNTDDFDSPEQGISLGSSTMGAIRIKRNVLGESSVGMIGTFGEPSGQFNNWMTGVDFTYQTTEFRGNKNFLAGVWGLISESETATGEQSAIGMKIDYPNDLWDVAFTFMRIGDGFDPGIGFVPRRGIYSYRLGGTYAPRPSWPWLRQMRNQLFMTLFTDLNGDWQTYRVFTAPINWRLESGERVEFNVMPSGETLIEPFEIDDGVIIPPGRYQFVRYRIEGDIAAKRKLNGRLTWWFGSFYEGSLDELEASINWNPSSILTFELTGTRNVGRLPEGDFTQNLLGLRVRFNVTPDLQINSFAQYDTESEQIGMNNRLHWIFSPQGEFFIVYNYNATALSFDRYELVNNQLLLKLRYNFRL